MSGLPPQQVLAILRIRQWMQDRIALKTARAIDYERVGWKERRRRQSDARIVRVIDFERAFQRLSHEEQTALAGIYRDNLGQDVTAAAIGCSLRKLSYLLPIARQHLADILDRLDLL